MIDGCTRIGAMVRIVLPMAIPGVVFSAMFSFTLAWNEFVYALTFISQTTYKTMSVAVPTELIRGDAYFWGELMAASLLGSVPVALLLAEGEAEARALALSLGRENERRQRLEETVFGEALGGPAPVELR